MLVGEYLSTGICKQVNNIICFVERNVDMGYLLFSKEAFTGTDLAISDKIRGLRFTAEVINSGTLYVFKNVL
jgi:hypothetical protein